MKLSYSTLACPHWTMERIIALARDNGYAGLELRYVEGEDSLWKLGAFQGAGLAETKSRIRDAGLSMACIDTSCFFHYPERTSREGAAEEGKRMLELAAQLDAPGIRIFGDRVQPGADRQRTISWVLDGISSLIPTALSFGVEVWLETHGDFASNQSVLELLGAVNNPSFGLVWDPANCIVESGQSPLDSLDLFYTRTRHVHLKDIRYDGHGGTHVLTGKGEFPLVKVIDLLLKRGYSRFLSFEWEKKWHPELEDAEFAVPHFAEWFRRQQFGAGCQVQ